MVPVAQGGRHGSRLTWIVVLAAVTAGAGCARKRPAEPVPVSVPQPPAKTNEDIVSEFTKRGIDARDGEGGVVINLPTVYLFEFDSATLAADAKKNLRELAGVLNDGIVVGRKVTVEGHADSVGSESYNVALSDKRAAAVIEELVSAGVDRTRLTKRAFGKERPLEPNRKPDGTDNPEGRARNRRVALIVENPRP